jgi:hypothetical protein
MKAKLLKKLRKRIILETRNGKCRARDKEGEYRNYLYDANPGSSKIEYAIEQRREWILKELRTYESLKKWTFLNLNKTK